MGLPREVRTRVLRSYRTDLENVLRGLSQRSQSKASIQNQP